jgi:hypothetical protein
MIHHLLLPVFVLGNLFVAGSSKSVMHGKVVDPVQAVIADARIEITADSGGSKSPAPDRQGFKTATFTDSYGNFSTELPPDTYNVCVSHIGFYTSCRKIKLEERMEAIWISLSSQARRPIGQATKSWINACKSSQALMPKTAVA